MLCAKTKNMLFESISDYSKRSLRLPVLLNTTTLKKHPKNNKNTIIPAAQNNEHASLKPF